jgi:acyl-CoA reductase-like NAD-dependent aldehyde dehydrogenase
MSHQKTYIDGAWSAATGTEDLPVFDSFTEQPFATYRVNSTGDVDRAVSAARRAFEAWSTRPLAERIGFVRKIADCLRERADAMSKVISQGVGMPLKLASRIQVGAPIAAWDMYAALAEGMEWEFRIGNSLVRQVPVGVIACITPWNYPLHQITGKVAPALLAGCTVVLKPSEMAPSSAFLLADAIEQAGLPAGVFNLIHGSGQDVGESLVRHADVDMISFTGSTRAGKRIAALAGNDIKRVALELGGKSAALVLPGADLQAAVKGTLGGCFLNSGQTCSAPTRLVVPRESLETISSLAREALAAYRMGDPADSTTRLGPLVSRAQQHRVKSMIDAAVKQGATSLTPDTVVPATGFFVAPTILTGVRLDMAIAQEEVFGPVLVVIAYDTVEEAIGICNGTDYGLAGSVWGATPQAALTVALRLRTGQIDINGAPFNPAAPFGGFKKSGVGRENGRFGIEEFLEPISIQLPPAFFETDIVS